MSAAAIRQALGTYSHRDEAFRRTFERDKKALIEMGVPLVTRPDPDEPASSVYLIEATPRRIEDPGLNPAERAALQSAVAALDLRDAGSESINDAAPGLRKLGMMSSVADELDRAAIAVDNTLGQLFGAIVDRRGVNLTYGGRSRQLIPRQLAHRNGNWYLRARDLGAAELRTYRVDRIEGPILVDSDAQDEVPSTPLHSLTMNPWEFGDGKPTEVTVRLDAAVASTELGERPDLEIAARRDDGSVDVKLKVRSEQGLHHWLLEFLDHAELLRPAKFRRSFVEHLQRLADPSAGSDR